MDEMNTERINSQNLFYVSEQGALLASEQDALDLLGQVYGRETDIIVVPAHRFSQEFFNLSNKQAGHFFQKMENYRMRLIVLGDISGPMARSNALRDFVREINHAGHHYFASDQADMEAILAR